MFIFYFICLISLFIYKHKGIWFPNKLENPIFSSFNIIACSLLEVFLLFENRNRCSKLCSIGPTYMHRTAYPRMQWSLFLPIISHFMTTWCYNGPRLDPVRSLFLTWKDIGSAQQLMVPKAKLKTPMSSMSCICFCFLIFSFWVSFNYYYTMKAFRFIDIYLPAEKLSVRVSVSWFLGRRFCLLFSGIKNFLCI